MLKFVPVTYEKLIKPYCDDNTLYGYIGYDLSDNSKECGSCVFRLNGYTMEILFVEASGDDAEAIEGLIRSALNFGGNRSVYIAQYKAVDGIQVAKKLGFESDNDILSGDIPSLLKGSCCKGK